MLWAWVMTIPICGGIGFALSWLTRKLPFFRLKASYHD